MSKEPIQIKKKRGGNNPQNLVPLTTETAREIGRKGGLATAAKNQEKKNMKEMLIAMLEVIDEQTGISTQEAMLKAQIDKALAGDTKAFEVVRDTSGQKPKDSVEISGNENSPVVVQHEVTPLVSDFISTLFEENKETKAKE